MVVSKLNLLNFNQKKRTLFIKVKIRFFFIKFYIGKSVYFDESHFESVLEIFPKMQFEVVEEGNHYLHISHHEEFLQKLIPFLNE